MSVPHLTSRLLLLRIRMATLQSLDRKVRGSPAGEHSLRAHGSWDSEPLTPALSILDPALVEEKFRKRKGSSFPGAQFHFPPGTSIDRCE